MQGSDLPVQTSVTAADRGATDYTFSFRLPGPGAYYLRIDNAGIDGWIFFWVDSVASLTPPADGPIVDVTKEGIVPGTGELLTAQLQSLINTTAQLQSLQSAAGPGNITTLLFPSGEYLTGALVLQQQHMRGMGIHLQPGAVIRFSDGKLLGGTPAPCTPADALVPSIATGEPSATALGDPMCAGIECAFLTIKGVTGVQLSGQGTLDANRFPGHSLYVYNSTQVQASGLLIMGSQSWAVPIRLSTGIQFKGVKVFSGADGFDPDASHDVTLDSVFVHSWDDAIAVKNSQKDRPAGDPHTTERIAVRKSILSTRKSAVKVGTESLRSFTNITFEDIDVFDTDRGVVLYAEDGGAVSNVLWRNLRLMFFEYPAELPKCGRAFDIMLRARDGESPLSNIRAENVISDFWGSSALEGNDKAGGALANITLRNITINVQAPWVAGSTKPYLFKCVKDVGTGGVVVRGLNVNWQGKEAHWGGLSVAHPTFNHTTSSALSVCDDMRR